MKLTERDIAQLRAGEVRRDVPDDGCPGLALRLAPDGRRVFTLRLRDASGKQVRVTLGDHHRDGFNLVAARARATELRAAAKAGVALRPPRPEAGMGYTVTELIDAYQDAVLSGQRRGHDAYLALSAALKAIAYDPAAAVTTAALARLIDRRAREAPAAARNLTSFLRTMFRWATERGHVPSDPAHPLRPPGQPARRDRVLSDAEIGAIWIAASAERGPAGPFVRVLMLCCGRLNELAGMRREEIDLERGVWIIPSERSKTRRGLASPLSPAALAEVERALAMRPDGTELVFTNGSAPISGWTKLKARLDAASGCTGWRFHDFRRTAVTRMADAGVDPAVADRVLNHQAAGTLSVVARVYQQSDMLEQRRAALITWEHHVLRCAGATQSAESERLSKVA